MTAPAPDLGARLDRLTEDLHAVLVGQTEIRGALLNLGTKVEAGDKQSEQLVALLKPRLEQLDREVVDLKGGLLDLRRELQQNLTNHSHEDAPHDKTLGARIGALERSRAGFGGALAVLGVGAPVITSLLTQRLIGS